MSKAASPQGNVDRRATYGVVGLSGLQVQLGRSQLFRYLAEALSCQRQNKQGTLASGLHSHISSHPISGVHLEKASLAFMATPSVAGNSSTFEIVLTVAESLSL